MSNGYEVDPATLGTHAAAVTSVAARVEKAAQAASAVGTGNFIMYGVLCGPVIQPVLFASFGDVKESLSAMAEFGDGMAEGIRSTRQSYEDLEQQHASALAELEGSL